MTTDSFSAATIADTPEGTGLTPGSMAFLQKRGIDPETAARLGVCTRRLDGVGWLTFPFVHDGKVVNHKYRSSGKEFRQDPDALQTFWNADAINMAIADDRPLLITEGEMDALSAIEAGYPWSVSVPAGAPQSMSDEDIDPEEDRKFRFVWENWDRLAKVRQIILAGDGDRAGQCLNHELKRRLGVERCRVVTYPEGAKDLNEVLCQRGSNAVLEAVQEAKPYPVAGLYRLEDFPSLPVPKKLSLGMGEEMDMHLRPYFGAFMAVTGIPGHGKSEFVDNFIFNMVSNMGIRACVFSGEMTPRPMYRNRLRRKLLRLPPDRQTSENKRRADEWINRNYCFISQDNDSDEADMTIERVIELATIAVVRYGIRILLIDPWNELEHKRGRDESDTEYTGRAIRMLKKFARRYEVLVVVVAHPSKMNEKGQVRKPTLYDINGSANWYNKADFGVICWRDDKTGIVSDIHVSKVKAQEFGFGREGNVQLAYDRDTGHYREMAIP